MGRVGGLPSAAGGAGGARDDEEGFALPPLAFALVLHLQASNRTRSGGGGQLDWCGVVVWSTRSAFAFSAVFRFLFISNVCCVIVSLCASLNSIRDRGPGRAAVE